MERRPGRFQNIRDKIANWAGTEESLWYPQARSFEMSLLIPRYMKAEEADLSVEISGLSGKEKERTEEIFRTRVQVDTLIDEIHGIVTRNPISMSNQQYEVTFFGENGLLPLSYRTTSTKQTPIVEAVGNRYRIGLHMELLEEQDGETHARELTTAELKELRTHVSEVVHTGTHFTYSDFRPPKPRRSLFRR